MESLPVMATIVVALAAFVYTVYLYKQEMGGLETRLRRLETPRASGLPLTKKFRKVGESQLSEVRSEGSYTSLHRTDEDKPIAAPVRIVEYREQGVETDPLSDREKKRPREQEEVRDSRDIRRKALAGNGRAKEDKVAMYLSTNFQRSKERFMATIGGLAKKGKNSGDRHFESPKSTRTDPLLYTSPSEACAGKPDAGAVSQDVAAPKPAAPSEKPAGGLFAPAAPTGTSLFGTSQTSAAPGSLFDPKPATSGPPAVTTAPATLPAEKPVTPQNLFSAQPPADKPKTEEKPAISLFGSVGKSEQAPAPSLFGTAPPQPTGGLFGAIPPSTGGLLGTTTPSATSLFGANPPAAPSNPLSAPSPIPTTSEMKPAAETGKTEIKETMTSLFGAPVQAASSDAGKPLSLFGTSEKTLPAGSSEVKSSSLFGSGASSSSLFGVSSNTAAALASGSAPASSSLFGGASGAGSSLFGQAANTSGSSLLQTAAPANPLAGFPPTSSGSQSLFGSSGGSLFGSASQSAPMQFGSSAVKTSEQPSSSLFGMLPAGFSQTNPQASSFGGADPSKNLFGSSAGSMPGFSPTSLFQPLGGNKN